MTVWRTGVTPDEAERLGSIMALAFDRRERGWTADEILTLSASPGVAVYARDEGFVMIRTIAEEAEILTIAVSPQAQGRGIGRRLLDHALVDAGDLRIFLEVGENNTAARKLYERAGFRLVGRRKGYLRHTDGQREDALILERPAPPARAP